MELFEKSTRQKWRFPSTVGNLTVEQLWDLGLTARNPGQPNLDSVARTINAELKSITEDSFVETKPNPHKGYLENQLEIVKHIIKVKLDEADAKTKAAAKQSEIRKLEEILAQKRETALTNLDEAELEKRLAELRAG